MFKARRENEKKKQIQIEKMCDDGIACVKFRIHFIWNQLIRALWYFFLNSRKKKLTFALVYQAGDFMDEAIFHKTTQLTFLAVKLLFEEPWPTTTS